MSSKDKLPSIAYRLAASKPKEAPQEPDAKTITPRRRRRQPETTINACNACRKKRTKCDGNDPCSKCSNRPGMKCTYEVNTRVSKEEMKREITELRQLYSVSMRILDSLAADRDVPRILQGLKAQEDLASIARLIDPSLEPESDATLENNSLKEECDESSYSSLMDPSPEDSQASYATGDQSWPGSMTPPSTTGSSNRSSPFRTPLVNELLVKHLLSLYWVWIHPAHPILNMAQFFKDYETCGSKHCSAYLVNAICAAACDLLDPSWERVLGKSTDVVALKQHLIAEAAIQAALADPDAPTTAHASVVIALLSTRTVGTSGTGF